MNKIIGFTISASQIDHSDVDLFKRGLNIKSFEHCGYHLYLWGIGDLDKCRTGPGYSLGFPLSENLLDRNVLISLGQENIQVENDWLGSVPVFYNSRERIVSTLSLKALVNKEIDPEGLGNFFEFGYSVYEQTPFRDVRFMRYLSVLSLSGEGIRISYSEDPACEDKVWEKETEEEAVFESIRRNVEYTESMTEGDIILPTSAGYDSRMLNLCIGDAKRIRSFTYGIGDDQASSFEVAIAREVANRIGTSWEHVPLSNYYRFITDWHRIYGFSTHLHGMYHIEFYNNIKDWQNLSGQPTLLSGIIGDVWGGNAQFRKPEKPEDLNWLAHAHGLSADAKKITVPHNHTLRNKFWEHHQRDLQHTQTRIIFAMRFKIMLLSYLTNIPEYFGWIAWTPFLNFSIASQMLNIPAARRAERGWQRDLFARKGLDISLSPNGIDRTNTLSFNAYMLAKAEPIGAPLHKIVEKGYVESINRTMHRKQDPWRTALINRMLRIRYLGRVLTKLGFRMKEPKNILISAPYKVLKAIDLSLNRHA